MTVYRTRIVTALTLMVSTHVSVSLATQAMEQSAWVS